jgi:hypothetical protein
MIEYGSLSVGQKLHRCTNFELCTWLDGSDQCLPMMTRDEDQRDRAGPLGRAPITIGPVAGPARVAVGVIAVIGLAAAVAECATTSRAAVMHPRRFAS